MAKIPALRIVPLTGHESYRAIGRAFSRAATDLPVDSLTKEEISALKSDPWLSVTDVEIDADEREPGNASRSTAKKSASS